VKAVLCLHGFTGTPFEIRPIADELTRLGYHVESPTLAGHGADVKALEGTGWRDWLRSAELAFDALAARTSGRIAVVGFSMGGLLALRLGRSRGQRIALSAMPVTGLQSLLELMAEVRDDLDGISAPALVAHGRRDRAVPISDSLELADRLDALLAGRTGAAAVAVAVERLWLDRSGHLVAVDVERDVLSRAVGHFLTTRGHW
jgi:carboxylesterase